jgi:DNA polymerase-3 subunit delta
MRYIDTMSKPVVALDYLAHPAKHPAEAVCAVFGDEPFLKRQVLEQLRASVLSGEDAEFSVTTLDGRAAEMRDVLDALAARALFGGGRHLVIVEAADDFVSQNRPALEDYAAKGQRHSVLVLEVTKWPSTTRLAKALGQQGLQVECKFPPPARLLKFLTGWAKSRHGAVLDAAAAELLADTLEDEMGLFDQELAKLAASAGPQGAITCELVRQTVGGWRAQTAWQMLDAALAGEAPEALLQLERLLVSGEVPIAILAQIGSTLRRFAAATRLIEHAEQGGRRTTLRGALTEAGFKPFVLARAEDQLRRLGRARAKQLYHWLLEADLALKGVSSSPARARWVLEQLILRLSAPPPPSRPTRKSLTRSGS